MYKHLIVDMLRANAEKPDTSIVSLELNVEVRRQIRPSVCMIRDGAQMRILNSNHGIAQTSGYIGILRILWRRNIIAPLFSRNAK